MRSAASRSSQRMVPSRSRSRQPAARSSSRCTSDHGGHQNLHDERGDGAGAPRGAWPKRCVNVLSWYLGCLRAARPLAVYAELARLAAAGEADFSRATGFALDEFVGIDHSHPASFHRFIREHLIEHVGLAGDRFHGLNGAAHDLDGRMRTLRGRDPASGWNRIAVARHRRQRSHRFQRARGRTARSHASRDAARRNETGECGSLWRRRRTCPARGVDDGRSARFSRRRR